MRLSLTYLLCQCTTIAELEAKAADLGCPEVCRAGNRVFVRLPTGERGYFRGERDGYGFVWCGADDAE